MLEGDHDLWRRHGVIAVRVVWVKIIFFTGADDGIFALDGLPGGEGGKGENETIIFSVWRKNTPGGGQFFSHVVRLKLKVSWCDLESNQDV